VVTDLELTCDQANVSKPVSVIGCSVGCAIPVLRCKSRIISNLPMEALTHRQAFPLVFGKNHGFNLWQTGLTFLGLFAGNVIGVSCDPFWRRNCESPA
jgi:hypothetical protein